MAASHGALCSENLSEKKRKEETILIYYIFITERCIK